MTTYSSLALRGLAAGGIAGAASALVQLLVTEIPLRAALAVEQAREPAGDGHAHSHGEEEVVSRGVQVVGGMLGVVIVGLAVGLVFATAYALSKRWFTERTPFSRSFALGAAVFGAVALLPWLKYPANPPAVGDPETVDHRTALYLGVVVAGLAIVWGASLLADRLRAQSQPVRVTGVLLAVVAAVAVVLMAFPAPPDTIPADVPVAVLWQFRLSSLAQLATLYVGLGVVFGLLVDPATRRARAGRVAGSPA
ncbi:Probable cobalt transporter subunit (CbtA) [Lentzea xinjiangensis]|uniref:Probable cobalt transporter subunit (CbtA) n=1 Tax=Lentzea xinjiangensis TaxID=402600 RepID=A0A1H9R797_9PSEU|nr:CbtA family protein [Lentzea xinjiangensis]SER68596.1 Probable cobalt transporter subunit (CbtA) [Lentzea xinjiangensis]